MRLICPNCGAQYEVPVDVIPEGGRDVQCSNCAHTWFQRHPDDDAGLSDDLDEARPDGFGPQEGEDDRDAPDTTPAAPPERPAPRETLPPPIQNMPDPEPAPIPARARSIDPDVAEVLREERELERRRRAAESQSLESQPELGLQEPDEYERTRREREARDRMARLRGSDSAADEDFAQQAQSRNSGLAAAEAAAAAAAGSRRDLLPDVEEINQTLRSSETRTVDAAERYEAPDKRRSGGSGFATGFFLIVLLSAIAIGIYAYAPRIAEALPQAASVLDAYVAQVDVMRAWLEGQIADLMTMLDGMSSEAQQAGATGT